MKRNVLITLGATLFMLFLINDFSYAKKNDTSKLEGIWAFKGQSIAGQKFVASNASIFKCYQNGYYTTFIVFAKQARITGQGQIKLKSDTVMTEIVKYSINASLVNKKNRLTYYIKDNKFLFVRFFIEKSNLNTNLNYWTEEVWERQ